MTLNSNHPAFSRLPKKLTISFPIWGLYDTLGDSAAYRDLDRFVREHVQRGFNCIRLDDGAGLIHDLDGNFLGPVTIGNPFGRYSDVLRQMNCCGDGGKCDLMQRLIELCENAKKYDVYLILSSWYYLHTYWMLYDEPINDVLFSIEPHNRFMAFAKMLHYILLELERRGLDDRIAFAEVFNEADGLFFINGYGGNRLSEEELDQFRQEHEAAIAMLQEKHPQILFAFDSYSPWSDPRQIPRNLQVYNFHNYFFWNIYRSTVERMPEFSTGAVTEDKVRQSRAGRRAAADDWYTRTMVYNNLDTSRLPEIEKLLENILQKEYDQYLDRLNEKLSMAANIRENYPDIPMVCGEGVSYIGHKELVWEEHSEIYWRLMEETILKYKEFGLWGTVIRTCCGPEDPCWNMCADKLLYLNDLFKGEG